MIRALFARLTGSPERGHALFGSVVAEARRPHWYTAGSVADTVEGRFAVLSTIMALVIVRLERSGAACEAATVALTERFIEAMDSEIREMGVGDPALGRQVRALVGALATRVERWRNAVESDEEFSATVSRSIYRDRPPAAEAVAHVEEELLAFWRRLVLCGDDEVAEGRLG